MKVTFIPQERTLFTRGGESVLDLAMTAGVHINASCGGNGTCGKCRVRVSGDALSEPTPHIAAGDYSEGLRLACKTIPSGDVVVEIPLESQVDRGALDRSPHILASSSATEWLGPRQVDPAVTKVYLELPEPTISDNLADMDRIVRGLRERGVSGPVRAGVPVLRELGAALRGGGWRVTASLCGGDVMELIRIEPGDVTEGHYALAVDIGTTTVSGELIHVEGCRRAASDGATPLDPGRCVLSGHSDYNAQISFGEDVISRIFHSRKRGGLKRLQEAVASTVNGIIARLLLESGVPPEQVSIVVAAGNTTMVHLLLGIRPEQIMLAPYVPVSRLLPLVGAREAGLALGEHARLLVAPCVSAYVGGDIVAGVVASGMAERDEISLFLDIGTNGEIVAGNREWLVSAPCSAGPAFEGGGIASGMRAATGAIEQVRINPLTLEPMLLTVGKGRPQGICGSGLIDTVAELLKAGIIDRRGKFRKDKESDRLRDGRDGPEYVLCRAPESATGRDITITEVDLDNVMRTKAAIFAGCRTLLASVGLGVGDVDRVIIAGGFGRYIDPGTAGLIGLLPEIPPERFVFIGNGALLGARLMALSKAFVARAEAVATMMTNLELSASGEFMHEYTAAMFLPHTEARLFPETERLLAGRDAPAGSTGT